MKNRSVLKKQAIKKRKRRKLSGLWRAICLIFSFSIKSSFILAGLIVLSLLFLYVYQYLLASPYLKIKQVKITGVDEGMKRSILKISQLGDDAGLLAINMDELKQSIEKHPWIKWVKLQKRFPHTLIIQAVREKPWAVVVLGELYYMNRRGKIFKKIDQTDDTDFPVITGVSESGRDKEVKLELAARVLSTLEAEKGPWALKELSEVHVKKNGNVSLYFRSLPAVVKLKGTELGIKMDDLKKVVLHLNRAGHIHMVREINLNYRDGAVVSFKNG
ncbi:MAG: FtsQ-type POTRA domain-containing protein [Desulfatiglandales bacterium]